MTAENSTTPSFTAENSTIVPPCSPQPIKPKHPGGRPRIIQSVEQFEQLAEKYFADCDAKEEPYCVPGLCDDLGFESRFALSEYERDKPEFSHAIKKARQRIERQRITKMMQGKHNTIGCIFDLKNNFGYKDKQDIELQGSVNANLSIGFIGSDVAPDQTDSSASND